MICDPGCGPYSEQDEPGRGQPATGQAGIGRLLRNLCLAARCVSVSSCALSERMERITLSAERARSDIQERHDAFAQAITSRDARKAAQDVDRPWIAGRRSEEHTSELQSLMRISYAVFCLKKKTEFIRVQGFRDYT